MDDPKNFRKINEIERSIIFTSISDISSKLRSNMDNIGKFLYISLEKLARQKQYLNIYLISNEIFKIIDRVNETDEVVFSGLYFGFIKKSMFYLSLDGAEYLYHSGIFCEFQQLHVNEDGEKSILYGNNILKSMMVKAPSNLKEKDFLLVFNELKEIIAIAQSQVNYKNLQKIKPKDVIAINLRDKGLYLRKDQ